MTNKQAQAWVGVALGGLVFVVLPLLLRGMSEFPGPALSTSPGKTMLIMLLGVVIGAFVGAALSGLIALWRDKHTDLADLGPLPLHRYLGSKEELSKEFVAADGPTKEE